MTPRYKKAASTNEAALVFLVEAEALATRWSEGDHQRTRSVPQGPLPWASAHNQPPLA
jgi:hypothetical protein